MDHTLPIPQEKQGMIYHISAGMIVAGAFSLPLFGNGAHNILLGLPIILLLFTSNIREFPALLQNNPTAFLSIALFLLMTLSLIWSTGDGGVKVLAKYREFLFIPMLMLLLSMDKYRHYTFASLYIALAVSLFLSYLIHYDLIDFTENQNSLKNRIFHGISMSFFAYTSLHAASIFTKYKYIFFGLFLLTLHNLFFIENGRTGYILIIFLSILFLWQKLSWKLILTTSFLAIIIAIVVLSNISIENLRLLGRIDLIEKSDVINLTLLQQIDVRIEYYLLSGLAFIDNWMIGCGIGCFSNAYTLQVERMETFWPNTVNAHNEFLQIGVQTGVVGLLVFCAFLGSMVFRNREYPLQQQQFQTAVFILVFVACLFNSSFMDHGDGALFMLLIALTCGRKWTSN